MYGLSTTIIGIFLKTLICSIENNSLQEMEGEIRKLTILYGSQTGTAQEVAERIWREARCNLFTGPIRAMDDYAISDLIFENVVVFVCSTTGQGEQPDNMKKFWKFLLRKNLPSNSLQNLRFAVLGLGDSSYVKFNHVAKKLQRRLETLGARPLCKPGLADDQHDLGADAVVDPWLSDLWRTLAALYSLPASVVIPTTAFPSSRWHVEFSEDGSGINENNDLSWSDNTSTSTLIANERITYDKHFQDVRLIRLSSGLKYRPGDVLLVRPHNREAAADQLIGLLAHFPPDISLRVVPRDADMPVPSPLTGPLTLRQLATCYWDLNAVPKRYVFQLLHYFTTSELEKEKLLEFTSAEGQQDLYNYCNRPRRTIVEVLEDFPHASANVPLPYLFDVFQPIRQRAFSIASSTQAHPGEINLLVAVVKYKTLLLEPRQGLCSNWLANRASADRIPVAVKSGSFRFPSDTSLPLLMVGPGTGVAPFRSLIQERVASGAAHSDRLMLVFGCRNRSADFHLRDEWEALQKDGKLSMLTAFSRDQPQKIYVQHVVESESTLVYDWLSRGCWVFVAGNANNMPSAVRSALVTVIQSAGGKTAEQAEQFVADLEANGMYQTETWS